jgi:uncharacterized protein
MPLRSRCSGIRPTTDTAQTTAGPRVTPARNDGYLPVVSERHRAVAWVKDDPFGVEFAEIEFASDRLTAKGVAIGGWPAHYRLDYELETAADFITSRLHVSTRGEGWRRILDLRRGEAGTWELLAEEEGELDLPSSGGDPTGFANALDCDLGLSPVTNLMPVLRHDLLSGRGRVELITAWVSVPDLSVRPDGQCYSYLRTGPDYHVLRYEATDGTFTADITVDHEGLVLDYPGIARRLAPAVSV